MILNAVGREVMVNDDVLRQIRKDGLAFSELPAKRSGTGPQKRIALLVANNGIGDDIHAMPAVLQKVRDGYDVDVYGRSFTADCYRAVGATFYEHREAASSLHQSGLEMYGALYYLSQWCLRHEQDTDGKPHLSRFDQFAQYIDGSTPDRFSWRDLLLPGVDRVKRSGPIVTAFSASSMNRSWPYAADYYARFGRYHPHMNLIALGNAPSEYKAKDLRDMVRVIESASLVISVDSGPLQIALALGVPALGIFGGSQESIIVHQYDRYLPDATRRVIRSTRAHGCNAPCNWQQSNGFGRNGKCHKVADCMVSVHIADVVRESYNILSSY